MGQIKANMLRLGNFLRPSARFRYEEVREAPLSRLDYSGVD
jgi:hypothetical protein